jgi:hypothetical protein
MQPVPEKLEQIRLRWRHRHGCYRWDGDGRCIDCRSFTGTPFDAVAFVDQDEVVFYDPNRTRLGETDGPNVVVPAVTKTATHSSSRTRRRPLTADQIATREAWRQWRAAQGDEDPSRPRNQRR